MSKTGTGLVDLPREVSIFELIDMYGFSFYDLLTCRDHKLIQMIAMLVPNDSDLCRMARTCRYFAQVINPPNSGVWRARFLDKYDHPPPDKSSEEVRIEYKVRSIILAQTPSFQTEEGMIEKLWLSVLTTLFVGM